jgi:hypothetical protein
VNPNWSENPWNAANPGGFLQKPADFFTSPEAAQLTRQKYRYVVARWGYSPAVLAWELFNEVHWVDALRIDHDDAAVAQWHSEMAKYLRSIDPYHHLVTTSTDNLGSAIYRDMDYLQPHLYATSMLAALRRFDIDPSTERRPIFYGEFGNDNMRLSTEQKASGVDQVPLAWASLMGTGRYAGQIWEGDKVISSGRLGELAALAEFLSEGEWATRADLKPFSAVVKDAPQQSLIVEPGDSWHPREPKEIPIPIDGRQALDFAEVPRYLVNATSARRDKFPARVMFKLALPTNSSMRVRLAASEHASAGARVLIDEKAVVTHAWPKGSEGALEQHGPRWETFPLAVAVGEHRITIENTSEGDWVEFGSLDTGVMTSVLTTIGQRNADFIALWVYHREGVFSVRDVAAARGRVLIDDVRAGKWRATWRDSVTGRKLASEEIEHSGGGLEIATPAINRHAVLTLSLSSSIRM